MPPLNLGFSLDRFHRGPDAGTFLDARDHRADNEDHWLGVLRAIQARDVAGLAEHLRSATGTLNLRTRSGRLRKGRLPHRVEALLAGNVAFAEHQRLRDRAYGSPGPEAGAVTDGGVADGPLQAHETAYEAHRWVRAHELVQWTVPDLLPAVIRLAHARAMAQATENRWGGDSAQPWISASGGLAPLLERGSAIGTGAWNPAWPDLVSALATVCLDHVGRRRFRDADQRSRGHQVYAEDDAHAAWLLQHLQQRLTRDAEAEIKQRQASFTQRIVASAHEDLPTVWDRALGDAQAQAQEEAWDLPRWGEWARRWMLGCERLRFPQGTAQVARAFWARWPGERLPVRRDDSLWVPTLLGEDRVFSDARLADWLVHGSGTVNRPAVPGHRRHQWLADDGYTSFTGKAQPWTWLEWAVDLNRMGLAQRLVNAGWRLFDGFEATYVPEELSPWAGSEEKTSWPAVRTDRLRRIEAVRLAEIACDSLPAAGPSVPRPRNRL